MLTKLKNTLLDKSIYYSFDRTGYERHCRYNEAFREDIYQKTCKGRYALVTGGTSGIGKYCAEFLASRQSKVFFTGRNERRGQEFAESNENLKFKQLDMGDWDQIISLVEELPKIDFLVLNAGGMPENFECNKYGVESQFASQLMGHYLLVEELIEKNLLTSTARIVWVTSGGMYLRRLTLHNIAQDNEYNKVGTYANTKRAQVILVEEMAKQDRYKGIEMNCMHPGWVDTPGVQSSIPEFREKTKSRLRDEKTGADTILWMLLTKNKLGSGNLYFDREIQKKYIFPWTHESLETRQEFLTKVKTFQIKFKSNQK